MLRLLPERTQDIKQFRSAPWPFQQTFKTPLKDLNRFVLTFLSQYPVQSGTVSTDEVVFEPRTVLSLIRRHSVPLDGWYEFTLTAEGQQDVAELIEAVLADWIDFVFVPFPTQFAIYADHDEFTTF